MPRDPYITLVGKIVTVIEALRDEPDGLTLNALTLRTGYVRSSIHRILQSLKRHGYVQQDGPGGLYRLGVQFLALTRAINRGLSLVQAARPYLRELVSKFDESAYLAVLRAERGIFVDVQETRRDLRMVGPLGAEVYFHATAAGKVMAAHFPTRQQTELLARLTLPRLTPHTLTSRARIEREWSKVRSLGFAVNDQETIVGAVFLAAPLFDAHRVVCGSISVGIPKPRFSPQIGRRIAETLKSACARLSDVLASAGYVHEMGQDAENPPLPARRLAG